MSTKKRGGARLQRNVSAGAEQRHSSARRDGQSSAEPEKKQARRGLKIFLIVLAVLAAIFLILLAVWKSWARLPDQPTLPAVDPEGNPIAANNPMMNTPRREGVYTFLVAGQDTGGGGNTDTMMLATYDISNQILSVMSLPRDTMVDARHKDRNRKLNGVWNLGLYYAKEGEEKEGVEYLKEAVGDMMGFVPDFYIVVNWEAFGRLVDAIGGVEFDVPFDMEYDDPTQNLHIHVSKGKRVLTGEEAMGVVRWRHNNSYSVGYATGDLGRIETQQALMKEVVKKCLKIENMTKVNQFAEIFTEEVDTDLTLGNLAAFAECAIFGGLKMDNVRFVTMPNTPVYVGKESYVQANPEELLGLLNDGFNPYKDDLTMDALHILQYKSSTGYYIYSGEGTGVAPVYTDPKPAAVVSTEPKTSSTPIPSEDPSEIGDGDEPSASARPSSGPADSGEPSAEPSDSSSPSSASPSEEPTQTPEPTREPEPEPEPVPTPASENVPAGIPLD